MDTIPADISTTEVITPGGTRESTIDTIGDRDWFRTELVAGLTYDILLEGTGTATELERVEYEIFDAFGNLILTENDFGTIGIERNSFTPPTDGTYFIAVAHDSNNGTGNYRLSLGVDEARNNVNTTNTLAVDGSVSGVVNAFNDQDWYAVTLEAGFSYNVRIEGTGTSEELSRVEYRIFDSSGNLLTTESDFGTIGVEENAFVAPSDGTFFIAALGDGSVDTGEYILSLDGDDTRGTIETTRSVSVGGTVSGSIESSNDQDWYRIDLLAGLSYEISLTGTGTSTGLDRVEFQIRDASGNLLTTESDFGTIGIETATFTPDADGTFYISANGDSPANRGDYQLSVGTDEARNSVDTTRTVEVGGDVTGTINGVGDQDWYAVTLEAGFDYNVTLEGAGTASDLPRVEFSIFDSNGTFLLSENDFGTLGIEERVFSPTTSGTFYISAEGSDNSFVGNYTLSVGDDDARSNVSTEREIAPGFAVTGEIGGLGDSDWYEIVFEAGVEYSITLEGDGSANALPNVEIVIHDSSGDVVARREDFGTAGTETILFTPTTSGTFYIAAEGENNQNAGSYILSVAGDTPLTVGSNEDDFLNGNAAAESFSGLGGDDAIFAGGGNDTVSGGAGEDILIGAGGDDLLIGGAGGDVLSGGDGFDIASYEDAASAVRADLNDTAINTSEAVGDFYTSIEGLTGSNFDDNLRGTDEANILRGGEGDDLLFGRGGNDILEGGEGADRLFGSSGVDAASYENATAGVLADLNNNAVNTGEAGGDTYSVIENLIGSDHVDRLRGTNGANDLIGGDGNDVINARGGADVLNGGEGADRLFGGSGFDVASFEDAASAVLADLNDSAVNTGEAIGDFYSSIEGLNGSDFDDNLRGTDGANTLSGGDGDDRLFGRGGNDILEGGDGADQLFGSGGIDVASYENAANGVLADLNNSAVNGGDADGDTYSSIEDLIGSEFQDNLRGTNGANTLEGGDGGDRLFGRNGADTLIGGTGDDVLFGGGGRDSFVFRQNDGADTISGFQDDIDEIDFSDTNLNFGNLAISDDGTDTTVDYGTGSVTILGTLQSQITEDDFNFA